MSTDANKEIVRRWNEELFNQRQADANDRFLHPNYVNHSANFQGLAAAKEVFAKVLESAPTLHLQMDDVIAEGDTVVARWTWQESGKVTATGISIYRIEDGKIIEDWYHSSAAAEA